MNNKNTTNHKEQSLSGLIKVLEESKDFDIKQLTEIEENFVFTWPSVLSSFFEFYALFYEGLSLREFIFKGILEHLESSVDLHLSDTQYGETLSKIIRMVLKEEFR